MVEKYKRLGYLINKASKSARWELSNKLAEVGLTASQYAVIKDIEICEARGMNTTPAEIANRIHSDRPTVSGILERLVKLGWVHRVMRPEDKRSHYVKLTEKAMDNRNILEDLSDKTMAQALKGFSEEELNNLTEYLSRIIGNFSTDKLS